MKRTVSEVLSILFLLLLILNSLVLVRNSNTRALALPSGIQKHAAQVTGECSDSCNPEFAIDGNFSSLSELVTSYGVGDENKAYTLIWYDQPVYLSALSFKVKLGLMNAGFHSYARVWISDGNSSFRNITEILENPYNWGYTWFNMTVDINDYVKYINFTTWYGYLTNSDPYACRYAILGIAEVWERTPSTPWVNILSPQNKTYRDYLVPLAFDFNGTASWMGYSLDGSDNVTISDNVVLEDLSRGTHTVVVYAADTSGAMYSSDMALFVIYPLFGTIYIRTDGSIFPSDAPISRNGDTYGLTEDIYSEYNGIIVEKDNLVLDGLGYRIQTDTTAGSTGIDLVRLHNVTTKNLQILGFEKGILAEESSDCKASGNTFINNTNSMFLLSTSSFDASLNNVIGNTVNGFYLQNSSYNNISNNDFSQSTCQSILLCSSSTHNLILGNNMTGGTKGIVLDTSSYNIVKQNELSHGGLSVYSSYENIVEGNYVNRKPLVYLERISNYSVSDAGQVILVNCTNIQIENLDLSNVDVGLELFGTDSTIIKQNNIANVRLCFSSYNTIFENNITFYGRDYLTGRLGFTGTSLLLYQSSNNNISTNSILGGSATIRFSDSNYMYRNDIESSPYGIIIYENCSDNKIIENNVTNGQGGILILGPWGPVANTLIIGNNVTGFHYGIAIAGGAGCVVSFTTLIGNNLVANYYGFLVVIDDNNQCIENTVFHNNFVDNTYPFWCQDSGGTKMDSPNFVWGDGYPSGGNYWSNHAAMDSCCGIYQNLTGSDGICDGVYQIDSCNIDRYPFTEPNGWQEGPVSLETNVTITDKTIRSTLMGFRVTGPTGETGYINATVPLGFNTTEIKVFIDSEPVQPPYPIIETNSTHYFVYCEFSLSSHMTPASVTLSVNPPETMVTNGMSFILNVDVENVTDLYAFDARLYFNTTLLQAVQLDEGSFLRSGGDTFVVKNVINVTEGYVRFASTLLSAEYGVNGTGTLFSVAFATTVGVIGNCSVTFGNTVLSDSQAYPIDHAKQGGIVVVCEVQTIEHPVTVNQTEHIIQTVSSSTVSTGEDFVYNDTEKTLTFNVTGPPNTQGFCDVAIPKELMSGTFAILVNGAAVAYSQTENATHCFLHFTYNHSTDHIEIVLTIPGDLNGDRKVDIFDLVIVAVAYDSMPGAPHWNALADTRKDNLIDIFDVVVVAKEFGKEYPRP